MADEKCGLRREELKHVDVMVFCYRPERGLTRLDENEVGQVEAKVKQMHDATFGYLAGIVESIEWYRTGGGLKVTLKIPLTEDGVLAVITAIDTVLT